MSESPSPTLQGWGAQRSEGSLVGSRGVSAAGGQILRSLRSLRMTVCPADTGPGRCGGVLGRDVRVVQDFQAGMLINDNGCELAVLLFDPQPT